MSQGLFEPKFYFLRHLPTFLLWLLVSCYIYLMQRLNCIRLLHQFFLLGSTALLRSSPGSDNTRGYFHTRKSQRKSFPSWVFKDSHRTGVFFEHQLFLRDTKMSAARVGMKMRKLARAISSFRSREKKKIKHTGRQQQKPTSCQWYFAMELRAHGTFTLSRSPAVASWSQQGNIYHEILVCFEIFRRYSTDTVFRTLSEFLGA